MPLPRPGRRYRNIGEVLWKGNFRRLSPGAPIEAPQAAMDEVLRKNEGVRELVGNGWLHLHALDSSGHIRRFRRRPTGATLQRAVAIETD